jgi:hypothetical protein
MRLRTFLLAVVSLTLVPMLLAVGHAIWWAHPDERRDREPALLYHARALTVAVDREVETSIACLKGLATSNDQAGLARETHRRWLTVALVDASGRRLPNLLRPLGSPLPSVAGLETFPRTLRTSEPQVSNLVTDPTARRWVVAVTLPSLREAHIAFGTVGTIVDRNAIVVARERIAQAYAAAERVRAIVADMNPLTRVHPFEHSGPGLPEMIDIRESAGGPGGAGAPPSGGAGTP